jgi:hypothetical protein
MGQFVLRERIIAGVIVTRLEHGTCTVRVVVNMSEDEGPWWNGDLSFCCWSTGSTPNSK